MTQRKHTPVFAAIADYWCQQRHHKAACPSNGRVGHLAGRDAFAQATDACAGGGGE